MDGDTSNVVLGFGDRPRGVFVSQDEDCFAGIGGFEYDGELGVIYPSFLPVNLGLGRCKPGVP